MWDGNEYLQPLDCESTTFRCKICQQPRYLHNTCPSSKGLANSQEMRNINHGYRDYKESSSGKNPIIQKNEGSHWQRKNPVNSAFQDLV